MNKQARNDRTSLKQGKIVDSVSASELLQALHTLQHISICQQELAEDLNISFSQKENFNHTDQLTFNPSQSQSTSSKINKTKTNNNNKQPQSDSHSSKMNFEFYMTQKQNKFKHKSTYQITNKNNTQKIIQKSITPKKKYIPNDLQAHNKSSSPLTERSVNNMSSTPSKINNSITLQRQPKLKNQSLTSSKLAQKTIPHNLKKQQKRQKLETNKNKQNQNHTFNPSIKQRDTKKPRVNSSINQLSIHQRNKQFLKLKNQKLAKLCQEMQEKKKQQEKQCTFKPKIIANNSHVKPKYNDLCASRQFYEKTHKRCKTGKQNVQNCFQNDLKTNDFNENKGRKNQLQLSLQQQLNFDQIGNLTNEQCDSRFNDGIPAYQKVQEDKSMIKKKYKNSKFNILLDMIH